MKIKKGILLFIAIPLIGLGQQDTLTTKTYFIGNRHFVVHDSIMPMKIVSENGEDLKSSYSNYHEQLNKKFPQWRNKTTIASGTMDIDLNVINKTQFLWKIIAIHLVIIDKKEIQTKKNSVHKWPYRMRGEEDNIHFLISNDKESFIYIPNNIILSKPNKGDNLLNITLSTKEGFETKQMLINFKFELDMIEVGGTNKTKITSDKTYYFYAYNSNI